MLKLFLWLLLWPLPSEDDIWRLRGGLVFDGMPRAVVAHVVLRGDGEALSLVTQQGFEFIYIKSQVKVVYLDPNNPWEPARSVERLHEP